MSDHRLIIAHITAKCQQKKIARTWRNTKAINVADFEQRIRSSTLFTVPANNVDEFADQLKYVVIETLDKLAPIRSRVYCQPKSTVRWMSAEAVAAKRQRRRLERRWRLTNDEKVRRQYRQSCRTANKLINASRRQFYQQTLTENANNPRNQWRVLNELLPPKDRDNTRTDQESRELGCNLSKFFLSKISKLKSTISD